ncbi:two-pore potassium channel 1-like [Cynara cardunculus var. scolymus]|uniref:two-pore potassium channel 1-like n=1 Tax=Cynara cardunculus var. scolymus TaxID=59895 RepID=UPI000D623297|nr:two-pore potassium channel 1-like [Cynara cardunculus var. scolymus]
MTTKDGNEDASSTKPWKHYELKIFGIGCLGYVFVATISFYFVIHQFCGKNTKRILDACYFAIILMTSSGYKDLTPNNSLAILLAICFAIVGMFIFGALMSLGANQILATQPKPSKVLDSAKNHRKMQYSSIMMIKYWKVLAVSLAVHMVGGIVLLVCIGNMHFFRALYCVSSTITTVLSIDECFSTEGRRIIALIWILYGMITLTAITGVVTEVWRQRTKWLSVKKNLERKPTLAELQPNDFDEDGFIRRDAYVRYRRREIKQLRWADMKPNIKVSGVGFYVGRVKVIPNQHFAQLCLSE